MTDTVTLLYDFGRISVHFVKRVFDSLLHRSVEDRGFRKFEQGRAVAGNERSRTKEVNTPVTEDVSRKPSL